MKMKKILNKEKILDVLYWYQENKGEIYTKKLKKIYRDRERKFYYIKDNLSD